MCLLGVLTVVGSSSVGCSSGSTTTWDDAVSVVGESATVCGPLVSARYDSSSRATFLNLGEDYPDPDRFTIVVWGSSPQGSALLDDPPVGLETCGSGEVSLYQGVAQIEMSSTSGLSFPGLEQDDRPGLDEQIPGPY